MKIAILDDYHSAALERADWSRITAEHEVKVFNQHLGGRESVTAALADFEALGVMRERTLLDRATERRDKEKALSFWVCLLGPPSCARIIGVGSKLVFLDRRTSRHPQLEIFRHGVFFPSRSGRGN